MENLFIVSHVEHEYDELFVEELLKAARRVRSFYWYVLRVAGDVSCQIHGVTPNSGTFGAGGQRTVVQYDIILK